MIRTYLEVTDNFERKGSFKFDSEVIKGRVEPFRTVQSHASITFGGVIISRKGLNHLPVELYSLFESLRGYHVFLDHLATTKINVHAFLLGDERGTAAREAITSSPGLSLPSLLFASRASVQSSDGL